jgi:hypothetical protein
MLASAIIFAVAVVFTDKVYRAGRAIAIYFRFGVVGTGGKTNDEGNEGEKRKVSSNMY